MSRLIIIIIHLIPFCFISSIIYAQEGEWDTSFGYGGGKSGYIGDPYVYYHVPGSYASVTEQADGKILVGGGYIVRKYNVTPLHEGGYIARLNADGSYDTSFYGMDPSRLSPEFDGISMIRNGPSNILKIHQLSDGKIIVAGRNDPVGRFSVGKLLSNGLTDSTFGGNGVHSEPGVWCDRLARDMGISLSGEIPVDLLIPEDESYFLMLGSSYSGTSGTLHGNYGFVGKMRPDGFLDSTWGNNGTVMMRGEDIGADSRVGFLPLGGALQPDGKFIITGNYYNPLGISGVSPTQFCIIRYNADGTIDNTFGEGGFRKFEKWGNAFSSANVRYMPDHSIVIVSNYAPPTLPPSERGVIVIKLNNDGSNHADFAVDNGMRSMPVSNYVFNNCKSEIQLNGKIVIGGVIISNEHGDTASNYYAYMRGFCMRLNPDAALDATFADGGVKVFSMPGTSSVGATIYSLCVQNNGKILLAGGGFGFDEEGIPSAGLSEPIIGRLLADSVSNPITEDSSLTIYPLEKQISWDIYPNPVMDNDITVQGNEPWGQVNYTIYDILGREMITKNTHVNNQKFQIKLDRTLPNGIYILHISKEGIKASRRFVLNR